MDTVAVCCEFVYPSRIGLQQLTEIQITNLTFLDAEDTYFKLIWEVKRSIVRQTFRLLQARKINCLEALVKSLRVGPVSLFKNGTAPNSLTWKIVSTDLN